VIGQNLATSPEPTDEEYLAKLAAARRRVRVVFESDGEHGRQPVSVAELAPKIAVPTDEPMQFVDDWEPPCVACGTPLGYRAPRERYVGITECPRCRAGNLAARLKASGIQRREMTESLAALVRPLDDPDYGGADIDARFEDGTTVRSRDAEFVRYMAFLGRFAALKQGERLDPPFAFVYGNLGTGKSAAAERALRDAVTNGCAGRAIKFSALVRKIYDAYGRAGGPERGERDERAQDIVRLLASIHLLLVHEVGPDAETDHALGLFFDFVDDRFGACLPTIFTSNYAPDEASLGARMGGRASDNVRVRGIIDRISGGGGLGENVFCLLGPSWRGRSAA
jgi:hypothetical protein